MKTSYLIAAACAAGLLLSGGAYAQASAAPAAPAAAATAQPADAKPAPKKAAKKRRSLAPKNTTAGEDYGAAPGNPDQGRLNKKRRARDASAAQ
jgi:hypothetical protein